MEIFLEIFSSQKAALALVLHWSPSPHSYAVHLSFCLRAVLGRKYTGVGILRDTSLFLFSWIHSSCLLSARGIVAFIWQRSQAGGSWLICQDWHDFQVKRQIVSSLGFSVHIRSPSLILSFILHLKNVNAIISCGGIQSDPGLNLIWYELTTSYLEVWIRLLLGPKHTFC